MPTLNWIGKEAVVNHHQQVPFRLLKDVPDLACGNPGDGNKRIGSFPFVDFLNRNGRLFRNGEPVINDVGLAALALLVAESDPKDKDVFIRLVMNMLAGEHQK